MAVTDTHEEKETIAVDVLLPGHEARVTTALFTHSKKLLVEREGGHCFISGMTAEQSGHPLEAHHHPIERSLANMVDWERFAADAKAAHWGPYIQAFDWDAFFEGAQRVTVNVPAMDEEPAHAYSYLKVRDPYLFVDDMTVNGMLLAKQFHTAKDAGIHMLPFPLWIIQKYAIEGYQFTPTELIHHADAA